MIVGYTQHGIFFYDKKSKKIKRGIKVKAQKKIKLNAKGLGTYVAFANKAKTKIFIVNKEAGKSTNKEAQVGYGMLAWLVMHRGWYEWLEVSAPS